MTMPNATRVYSFHSLKGGVGKTTLALALAAEIASGNGQVCYLDLDFLGGRVFPEAATRTTPLLKVLTQIDRTSRDGFARPVRISEHRVRVLGHTGEEQLSRKILYLGWASASDGAVSDPGGPALLSASQSYHMLGRLEDLIRMLAHPDSTRADWLVAEAKEHPRSCIHFVLDLPPGLQGLSALLLRHSAMAREQPGQRLEFRKVIVGSPQIADLRAIASTNWRTVLGRGSKSLDPRAGTDVKPLFVLNRASREIADEFRRQRTSEGQSRFAHWGAETEKLLQKIRGFFGEENMHVQSYHSSIEEASLMQQAGTATQVLTPEPEEWAKELIGQGPVCRPDGDPAGETD